MPINPVLETEEFRYWAHSQVQVQKEKQEQKQTTNISNKWHGRSVCL